MIDGEMLLASELVAKALHLNPDGVKQADGGICICCGRKVAAGELGLSDLPFGSSFTDGPQIAWGKHLPKRLVCGWCNIFFRKKIIGKVQKFIATQQEVLPMWSKDDQSWVWANLPHPPFVICGTDAKMQHIVWQGTVTESLGLVYWRVGKVTRLVRYELVKALSSEVAAFFKSEEKRKHSSPFLMFDWGDLYAGQIREKDETLMKQSEEGRRLLKKLSEMNIAETKVMTSILEYGERRVPKPTPMNLS